MNMFAGAVGIVCVVLLMVSLFKLGGFKKSGNRGLKTMKTVGVVSVYGVVASMILFYPLNSVS
jgi:hypothetical protein